MTAAGAGPGLLPARPLAACAHALRAAAAFTEHAGLLFACFYTRVFDHVLRPLMAPDRPNAPPELAAALDTLDQLTASHIAAARVPITALPDSHHSPCPALGSAPAYPQATRTPLRAVTLRTNPQISAPKVP